MRRAPAGLAMLNLQLINWHMSNRLYGSNSTGRLEPCSSSKPSSVLCSALQPGCCGAPAGHGSTAPAENTMH